MRRGVLSAVVLSFALVASGLSSVASMSPLLGGKSERSVDDHAQQLAAYAVTEIGAKANLPDLSLVRVTKLSTQVVAGMKYYFSVETKDKAGKVRHYEAQVWEKPGGYGNGAPVELTSYKEVSQAPTGGSDDASWSEAAAQAAVAGINMRSNSLVPYQLVEVASTTPVDNGAKMVLSLRRGDKHEAMEVHVERREGGRYGLLNFGPAP